MFIPAVLAGIAFGGACGFVLQRLAHHGLWVLSLVAVAVFYPIFGLIDGDMTGAALHGVILLVYLVFAYRALSLGAEVVAVGFLLHGLFDAAVAIGDAATGPDWWPPFCAAFDIVFAMMLMAQARRTA